jgi:rhodanese-related sulfurtransferase
MKETNVEGSKQHLPEGKKTTLELYVTSKEAYEMWKAAPDKIKILDVRTNEEYVFVGHAEMAWNIPAFLQRYQWDAEKSKLPMILNPDFMAKVKEVFQPDDTILVTCRSGGRSAMAINMMVQAGYKNLYNITDGFEGDAIHDPESEFDGKNMRNGWKNAALPWTYVVDPDKMITCGCQ